MIDIGARIPDSSFNYIENHVISHTRQNFLACHICWDYCQNYQENCRLDRLQTSCYKACSYHPFGQDFPFPFIPYWFLGNPCSCPCSFAPSCFKSSNEMNLAANPSFIDTVTYIPLLSTLSLYPL